MTVKGVGELAYVVVPAELQWTASIVLDTVYGWPLMAILKLVTLVVMVCHFFFVKETLLPPSVFFAFSSARFLGNMGKEGGQLPFASFVQCLVISVVLIAEGRELGDTLNEVIVGKKFVDVRELLVPL